MKNTLIRTFSFLLALCLLLTVFPFAKTRTTAAALDPTNPEDAVTIYMNNKSKWNMSYSLHPLKARGIIFLLPGGSVPGDRK